MKGKIKRNIRKNGINTRKVSFFVDYSVIESKTGTFKNYGGKTGK